MNKDIFVKPWFLYIAKCRDGTLYVGVAQDVYKRIKEHNTTNRCRYTRFRKPLILIYKEKSDNYSLVRKRESEVKKFSRKKKLALIEQRISEKLSHPKERGSISADRSKS